MNDERNLFKKSPQTPVHGGSGAPLTLWGILMPPQCLQSRGTPWAGEWFALSGTWQAGDRHPLPKHCPNVPRNTKSFNTFVYWYYTRTYQAVFHIKQSVSTAKSFARQLGVHVAFVRQYKLGWDAIIRNGSRHKVAQNGGRIRSIQNQVFQVLQQVVKCYKKICFNLLCFTF